MLLRVFVVERVCCGSVCVAESVFVVERVCCGSVFVVESYVCRTVCVYVFADRLRS